MPRKKKTAAAAPSIVYNVAERRLLAAGWKNVPFANRYAESQGTGYPRGVWVHKDNPGPHTTAVATLIQKGPTPDGEPFAAHEDLAAIRKAERAEIKAARTADTEAARQEREHTRIIRQQEKALWN